MVATLEPKVIEELQRKLHAKDFVKASANIKGLKGQHPAHVAELDAILASHPGNPDNPNAAAAAPASNGQAKKSKLERRNDVLRRWKADEIDDETKDRELALLEGEVDMATILNVEEIAKYPTRSLGDKGNTGWYFRGPVQIGGRAAKVVSLNIILDKTASKEVSAAGSVQK